ncbi:ABC-three component system middle component 6 [Mycoplasmopsis synoviae]|uniref:ABC-three component system middle component 6 n=2 Tax=Mycoplasmopsis synoviae TaxID=2109 RepID=UPI00356B4A2B
MLMPREISPKSSIFFNASFILKEMKKIKEIHFIDLYNKVKEKMSFSLFILCLDWLYLIDFAKLSNEGILKKCI